MKIFISFLVLISTAMLFTAPAKAQSETWLGSAPFCKATPADCTAAGMTFVRTHASGDGDTCLTGVKVLCRIDATTLDACPANAKTVTSSLNCSCSAAQTKSGAVWGSAIYTDDSSVCRAALHAGIISNAGGVVKIEIRPGQNSYNASSANGVSTTKYGKWGRSFVFVK